MEKVVIVDTSFVTDNLGDQTIMDAVNDVVWSLFPRAYISRVPSHEPLTDRARRMIYESDWCFLGGTNLLSSYIHPRGQWRIGPADVKAYSSTRTVCLGIGWVDYQSPPSSKTRTTLQKALSADLAHSVRDNYTSDRLQSIGLKTIPTSCPTTWHLTPEFCATLPSQNAASAIITLTSWRPDVAADRAFIEVVRRHYKKVYFFPQMLGDVEYFEQFGYTDIGCIASTNEGYTHVLETEDVDVIGSRLHGGIRALQRGRRALILSVDNRAVEIGKDTGLPVVARTDTKAIEDWLVSEPPIRIHIPQAEIEAWKAQFDETVRASVRAPHKAQPPKDDAYAGPLPLRALRKVKRLLHAA